MKSIRVVASNDPEILAVLGTVNTGQEIYLGCIQDAKSSNPVLCLQNGVGFDAIRMIMEAKWPADPAKRSLTAEYAKEERVLDLEQRCAELNQECARLNTVLHTEQAEIESMHKLIGAQNHQINALRGLKWCVQILVPMNGQDVEYRLTTGILGPFSEYEAKQVAEKLTDSKKTSVKFIAREMRNDNFPQM